MMGANNGTGQPNWFRCSRCRVNGARGDGSAENVELTGRQRPHRGKAGARNSFIDREYRCRSCGHLGWSCHIDLARKAGEHRELQIKNGKHYPPSYMRPRPDFDPRIDYPERYTDGPI